MRSLSIAAASIDVHLAGDAHRSSGDGCIEQRFAKKVDRRPSLRGLVGGQVSPRRHAVRSRGFCGLRGLSILRLEIRDLQVSESRLGEGATRVRGGDTAQNASADSHQNDQSV
jgi:hypothetical protein